MLSLREADWFSAGLSWKDPEHLLPVANCFSTCRRRINQHISQSVKPWNQTSSASFLSLSPAARTSVAISPHWHLYCDLTAPRSRHMIKSGSRRGTLEALRPAPRPLWISWLITGNSLIFLRARWLVCCCSIPNPRARKPIPRDWRHPH